MLVIISRLFKRSYFYALCSFRIIEMRYSISNIPSLAGITGVGDIFPDNLRVNIPCLSVIVVLRKSEYDIEYVLSLAFHFNVVVYPDAQSMIA